MSRAEGDSLAAGLISAWEWAGDAASQLLWYPADHSDPIPVPLSGPAGRAFREHGPVTVSAAPGPLAAATTDPAVAAELAAAVSTSLCGDMGGADEPAAAETAGLFIPAVNAEGGVEAVLQVTHPVGPAGLLTAEDGVVSRVLARHLGVALQNHSLRGGGGGGGGGVAGCLAEVMSQNYEEAVRRMVPVCRARLGAEHVEVLFMALLA